MNATRVPCQVPARNDDIPQRACSLWVVASGGRMQPKSLNVIPRVPRPAPALYVVMVRWDWSTLFQVHCPWTNFNHKSMTSSMANLRLRMGAPLCRVERNMRDKMFPGRPDRWWLKHWAPGWSDKRGVVPGI